MRKWKNDFKNPNSNEVYYDLFDDWDLIESSFTQQYGIRLRKEMCDMQWGEFCSYLAGLNGETPLGNVVRIRSENDPKILKDFSKEEKRIRSEWRMKHISHVSKENYNDVIEGIKNMFKAMSKGGENK